MLTQLLLEVSLYSCKKESNIINFASIARFYFRTLWPKQFLIQANNIDITIIVYTISDSFEDYA